VRSFNYQHIYQQLTQAQLFLLKKWLLVQFPFSKKITRNNCRSFSHKKQCYLALIFTSSPDHQFCIYGGGALLSIALIYYQVDNVDSSKNRRDCR